MIGILKIFLPYLQYCDTLQYFNINFNVNFNANFNFKLKV